MMQGVKVKLLFFGFATLSFGIGLCGQVVVNAGSPGENTAEIEDRAATLLRTVRPDIVVLFTGMNDAVNEKKFLTPERTRQEALRIVHMDADAGATTVIVTVHAPDDARLLARHDPKVYADRSPSLRVDAVNGVLQQIAQKQHLAVADFHAVLQRAGGANAEWSTDGVHLTSAGYGLLAKTVRSALPADLSGKTILCLGDSITYGIGVRDAGVAEEGSRTYPEQLRQMLQAVPRSRTHSRAIDPILSR